MVTHLAPEVVLQMTPDQSEIILEEYVAMNDTGGGSAERVTDEAGLGGLKPQTASSATGPDADLARRINAEMYAKLHPLVSED